jgi:hypothetical protein
MAKIKFTLHGITNEIRKAEKRLRSLRAQVVEADQKKIDLNLRELQRSYVRLKNICPPKEGPIKPYGQWFVTKPKRKP